MKKGNPSISSLKQKWTSQALWPTLLYDFSLEYFKIDKLTQKSILTKLLGKKKYEMLHVSFGSIVQWFEFCEGADFDLIVSNIY